MLVAKFCKKALLVLVVVMLLAPAATAAPSNSALTGGKSSGGDESLERVLDGGITITARDVTKNGTELWMNYVVVSEEDTVLKVETAGDRGALFDGAGRKFVPDSDGYYTHIGGTRTKEREIIGGVPTTVQVYYRVDGNYSVAETFPRVSIVVNGKTLTFRNVPGAQQ